jgi:hypothetical protein
MRKEELWDLDGVGLAKDEHGKAYLLVDGSKTEKEALQFGKDYFKCAKSMLKVEIGRLIGNELFDADTVAKKSQVVWQITREVMG